MPSFGKFKNELVFTQSIAFSPIYDVHRSKNEAVHLIPEEEEEEERKKKKKKDNKFNYTLDSKCFVLVSGL